MKKALALIGTIIFVFSIVPMGAFATDGDYPDHTNNIAPYVHSIINLFANSATYTVASSITDVEYWRNGTSLGTATGWTFDVPSTADCVDVDFWWPLTAGAANSTVGLLNVYIRQLQNIDYIELYAQGTYQACPIYYYTYYSNQFYIVFPGQGITSSSYYTLRIHLKQGGFQFNFLANVDPILVQYYTPDTNSSFQEQYAQWYYLTSLLRELDSLEFNVSNLNIDTSNMQASLSTLESIFRNARYGYYKYLLNDSSYTSPLVRIYRLAADGSVINTSDYTYSNNNYNSNVYSDFILAMKFDMGNSNNRPLYFRINIPFFSINYQNFIYSNYQVQVDFANSLYYRDFPSNMFDNYNIAYMFRTSTNNDINYDYTQEFLTVCAYIPLYANYNNSDYIYIKFHNLDTYSSTATTLSIKGDFTYDTHSFYAFTYNTNSQVGFELSSLGYMSEFYRLLTIIADQSDTYPSGPSDPQDPNQTTNIYDVNIEFNTQVGDISVFENTYSQQLPTYDQSISDQYLIPVSNSYDFSDLNSTFNSIWQSSFQYDTDEEDNITGVYGIGLYFIIPLVLLVLFALFRRVTS